MTPEEKWICPSCAALDESYCWHTRNQWQLATAFAASMYQPYPTVQEIEAFLEDAESVDRFVGPGPWTIVRLDGQPEHAPMSTVFLLTSSTGTHVLGVDAEQERMANQCVVPAQFICTLPAGVSRD